MGPANPNRASHKEGILRKNLTEEEAQVFRTRIERVLPEEVSLVSFGLAGEGSGGRMQRTERASGVIRASREHWRRLKPHLKKQNVRYDTSVIGESICAVVTGRPACITNAAIKAFKRKKRRTR